MKFFNSSLIAIFCTLLSACHLITPQSSTHQLLRKDYVSNVDNQAHQYFIYLPEGYTSKSSKQWPVILFLHGNGERGNGRDELDYVISHGPLYEAWIQKKSLPFIIIAPQLPVFSQASSPYFVNRTRAKIPKYLTDGAPTREPRFATEGLMLPSPIVTDVEMSAIPPLLPEGWEVVEQDLLNMVSETQKNYHTDPARLYLTGLSYGGFGTWHMASQHPTLFAAIAPVVGWGHPSLMAPIAQHQIPVWVFAGGRDSAVDKKFFYPGLNTLEKLGHKDVRFTVEEDMAHDAWTRVYAGDDLYNWLLSHRNN